MKQLFKFLKPWIKAIIIKQMKSQQEEIINLLCKKVTLPMNGELQEQFLNTVYTALEQIVEEQIEKV
jgi:hypothetical protein